MPAEFNLFKFWDKGESNTKEILDDKILQQESVIVTEEGVEAIVNEEAPKQKEPSASFWGGVVKLISGGDGKPDAKDTDSILDTARDFIKHGETSQIKPDVTAEAFRKELEPILKTLQNNFSDLPKDKLDPIAFGYYLEAEDSKKNPSWKRRMHRFCPGFDLETIYKLHEELYFAELAYVDSVEEIQAGIENFQRDRKFELVFASVEGVPRQPAHFLALQREAESDKPGRFPWSESYLQVLLVVRGTKELADMMSDALMEATEYRNGKAHDGIMKSGQWLVEKHLPLLNHLLEKSGRKKIKLHLIGHSLGAGAAAIACMEFNDQSNIQATCVAFNCPALVDEARSIEWKDKITTIVSDADCVPRMSGGTLYNMLVNILEHDYKERAMEDVKSLLHVVTLKVPLLLPKEKHAEILQFTEAKLDERVKPLSGMKRAEIELFPPGKCYHLYRDGFGYSFVEVSCNFFNEIDVAVTMADDHYTHSGCHAMFLALMRSHLKNSKFEFPNDLMALRQEKPAKEEETDKEKTEES